MTIKKGSITIASSTPTTEWGSIEGTLADQVDLKAALDTKATTLSPALTGIPTTPLATEGDNTNQIASTKFVNRAITNAIENIDALPDQTGKNGKFLTTNGTDASWGDIPSELPSQSGQAGKVLTTNGSSVSWTEYQSAPATDDETIHLNSSDELEVIGTIEKNAGDVKYDWVGTYTQWQAGREGGTIPDDWICYITDDYIPSTVTHNIGDIFYSLRTENIMNGAVVCDGSEYNIADFSLGNISLKSLLDDDKIPYVSISNFDATVLANGSCRCFGYDGEDTFKVPKLNDVFIEAGVAANNSEFIEAGLPNITGTADAENTDGGNGAGGGYYPNKTGAFYSYNITNKTARYANYNSSNTDNAFSFGFDASRSSSIYGNSNTVQPNAVKYRAFIQLANATSESALQTVSSVVNDVTTLQEEMEETLKYKNITNCITEIPQDIKLELNNGTLTLKAGSKVYVPNGSGVFDAITTNADKTYSYTGDGKWYVFIAPNNGNIDIRETSKTFSGDTAPTGISGWNIWYDTTNNYVKKTTDSGSTWTTGTSLPIAIITISGGAITSIDQVFNGFGYIGSTVFALPGVKGLIPNGRNDDGSLKSTSYITTSVITRTWTTQSAEGIFLLNVNPTGSLPYLTIRPAVRYDENSNKLINVSDPNEADIGLAKLVSGKIDSISTKTSFHALDWNDKSEIYTWMMPSNKYIDLTLNESGSTYTAPANGWVAFDKRASSASQYVNGGVTNRPSLQGSYTGYSSGVECWIWFPVKKGDVYKINYTTGGATSFFIFIYAEGEI